MTKKMNAALLKELSSAAKAKFDGAIVVESKESTLTGRIYFYKGGIYAAQVDGFYPRIVARMAAGGMVDLAREEHLRQHFGGNILDPEIGAYAVQQGWLGVDALSAFHQEYLLAALGALLSLPRVKVKKHKGETTNLFCTVPLPWAKVEDTLDMRTTRFTNTWVPISPNVDPNRVVPQIIDPLALDAIDAPEIRTIAAAIDGQSSVDAIAWRCGYTRAEAVHLLSMMVDAGAVVLTEAAPQAFDKDNLFVPEAAGAVMTVTDMVMPETDEEVAVVEEDDNDIHELSFGEADPEAVEEVHEVKEKKRGLFGWGSKKKHEEETVEEDPSFNANEWVAPELSEMAVTGYEMENDPFAEAPVEDEPVVETDVWVEVDDTPPSDDDLISDEPVVEEFIEEPILEEEAVFVEPVAEEETVFVEPERVEGLLTKWATMNDGEKRDVRLNVLMRMVEAAKADVEDKQRILDAAQANLDVAQGEFEIAEEHGRAQQSAREASDRELASLESIRDDAKNALDMAVEALEAAMQASSDKATEILEAEQDVERLRAELSQAESKVEWLNGEKVDLDGKVDHARNVEGERTETLSEASLRVTEYNAGPHAQAIEAERVAYEHIETARETRDAATSERDTRAHEHDVANEVLSETVSEAEAAAAIAEQQA